MEQETASIAKFILDATDNPTPYYWNIPEDFTVPAAYFPTPEVTSAGETFLTYRLDYSWYIVFFNATTERTYPIALQALTAIRKARNLIPLLDEDGNETGEGIRIKDPQVRTLDVGAVQISVEWSSRRPYGDVESYDGETMQTFDVTYSLKSDDDEEE